MKKPILYLVTFLITMGSLKGQDIISCLINFEENYCWEAPYYELSIPGNNNSWQVCTPSKTHFTSSYSLPQAILTDSVGSYAINDTSSFIFKFITYDYCMCAPIISGYYKIDSDTLKDFGRIEFSLDYGSTWLDALSDSVVPQIDWITEKPVLTGRIQEWRHFSGYLPWDLIGDTVYYRFTFISDSIQTNQDGWILDNLALIDHIESYNDSESSDKTLIYPNPATNFITVSSKFLKENINISIYDIHGRLLLTQLTNIEKKNIDISTLFEGIYLVKISSNDSSQFKIIVKNK